jgi:protein N-terminal amidase
MCPASSIRHVIWYPPGYVFDSAQAISPYLEQPRIGPTSRFCQELAEQLSCYVAAGYPERLEPDEANVYPEGTFVNPLAGEMKHESNILGRCNSPSPERHERMHVGANSAVLYSPSGECVLAYRKTNLFETDVTWAKPGTCMHLLDAKRDLIDVLQELVSRPSPCPFLHTGR